MGKSIDLRLHELGARRVFDLHCADESTNLEEIVELFKYGIISTLMNTRRTDHSAGNFCEINIETTTLTERLPSLNLPVGLLNMNQIQEELNITIDFNSLPPHHLMPKQRNLKTLEYQISTKLETKFSLNPQKWSIERPYYSTIKGAKWLSKQISIIDSENDRKVIQLELDLTESNIKYQTGDSLSICPPNPIDLVGIVLDRISQNISDQSKLTKDSILITPFGEEINIVEYLLYRYTFYPIIYPLICIRVDLVGVPRKPTVYSLSQFCKDPFEKSMMQWLCSKDDQSKTLWDHFIHNQRIGIGELLILFPSCYPDFSSFLSCVPPMSPRSYSICSSQLQHPSSAFIAFSVVQYNCSALKNNSHKLCRKGLCTSYLESILVESNLLSCTDDFKLQMIIPNVQIRIFHRPSTNGFHLPCNVSYPLLMIGPGTGVAPFIGFLEHRAALEEQRKKTAEDICSGVWRGSFEFDGSFDLFREGNPVDNFMQSVQPGPIWLFFGCRHEHDWLFKVLCSLFFLM